MVVIEMLGNTRGHGEYDKLSNMNQRAYYSEMGATEIDGAEVMLQALKMASTGNAEAVRRMLQKGTTGRHGEQRSWAGQGAGECWST